MKLLFFYCGELQINNIVQSTRTPKFEEEIDKNIDEKDSLLAFVCVESKDDEKYLEDAVAEIKKIYDKVKAKSVVLLPFAHLTEKIPKTEVSFKVIDGLYRVLVEKGFNAKKAHFASYKDLRMYSPAGPYQVAFRTIPKPKWFQEG